MTAKEYVSQIKKLDTLIKNKSIEKEIKKQEQIDIALSIGAGGESVIVLNSRGKEELHKMERVQSSSNGEKLANAVNEGVDIERRYDAEIARLEAKRQSIIDDIEKLPEAEYDVLHLIYVQHLNFDEAAEKRKISRRTVASIHGMALINLEKVSNCRDLHEFA